MYHAAAGMRRPTGFGESGRVLALAQALEDCGVMAEAYLPLVDAELELSDGRALGYAIWGDPQGQDVLLFHGAPSSRMFAPDPAVTAARGVRLVTIDRPGYGRSDPQSGRQILDWPSDVAHLADALDLQEFAVMAHSSGGPYALACALAMPERVSRVVLASCVVPVDELTPDLVGIGDDAHHLVELSRSDPARAATMIADSASWLLEEPDRFLSVPRPEPDTRLLQDARRYLCSVGRTLTCHEIDTALTRWQRLNASLVTTEA